MKQAVRSVEEVKAILKEHKGEVIREYHNDTHIFCP